MIGEKETEKIKRRIEEYYHTEKVLAWNRQRLERLYKRLAEIEKDRNSPYLPMALNTDLQGIEYDQTGSKGGMASSPMERNIEQIYRTLDNAYEKTQNEIVQLKVNIQKLEDSREEMDFYIHLLNEECQKILEYRHKQKKGVIEISFLMNLSKSSVSQILYEIYGDLHKLISYCEAV